MREFLELGSRLKSKRNKKSVLKRDTSLYKTRESEQDFFSFPFKFPLSFAIDFLNFKISVKGNMYRMY